MVLALLACTKPDPVRAEVAVSEVTAALHPDVATMIRVSWTQDGDASAWVAFDAGDGVVESPAVARGAGLQEEWILGVPADTDVAFRVVTGSGVESAEQTATTGPLPPAIADAEVPTFDPDRASPERFVYGSVDVDGGEPYGGPFWLFVADRQGRIVWYREVGAGWQPMFPRIARDGTHVAWDQHNLIDPDGQLSTVQRTTLDGSWSAEVPTPGLGWCWDETDDGALLYDRNRGADAVTIEEIAPDGTQHTVWDCTAWLAPLDPDPEHCYTNTVNWNAGSDTILWSTYWGDWIAEVDRWDGEVAWYAGLPGGYDVGADAPLDLQHYPNYTPDGTLLVSTHLPGVAGQQRAREFAVDHAAEALDQVWVYGEGVDDVWAQYSGEAVRLPNGNTVQNYGTGGEMREVDPAGAVVWSMRFGDEHTLGHTELVDDLYALNRGR